MSNKPSEEKPPQIAINYEDKDCQKGGSGFVAFPRFWVDEFFNANFVYADIKNKNGSARKAQRVPASFWKYTFYLWRHVSVPRNYNSPVWTFTTDIPLDKFPVRSDAAIMWTAAYAVSGVMGVEVGRWTKQHDQPTVFTYHPGTSHRAWRCFLSALDFAYNLWQNQKKGGPAGEKFGANGSAWKVLVAREVDNARRRVGYPPINEKFLDDAAAGRITDQRARPIAERDGNGIVQPLFYGAVSRNGDED